MADAALLGLVLGGGKSTRMGRDKASLAYHGKPQIVYAWELLQGLGIEAFVSCRADQADAENFRGLPQIHDRFLGFGPMGGILSALLSRRDAAFLVLACDLPHLDAETLSALIAARDPSKIATAYLGHENLPEPLCAIYEPSAYSALLGFVGQGLHCPRKSLIRSDIRTVAPAHEHALANVNRPEEYEEAVKELTRSGN
jgi:molybdopterin-guanine dinucleotide biosynthesis protein A